MGKDDRNAQYIPLERGENNVEKERAKCNYMRQIMIIRSKMERTRKRETQRKKKRRILQRKYLRANPLTKDLFDEEIR